MNWIDKTVSLFSPATAIKRLKAREMLTEFRYEGAMPSRDRQLVGFTQTQNTESSSNARDRLQLMSEARELMQNFPLVKGIILSLCTYAFGIIKYQARTGDSAVDAKYEAAWEAWCEQCDISGRHNFGNLMRLAFLGMLRDGDCGFVQRITATNYKLQLIEADRIGRPQEVNIGSGLNSDQYYSGVIADAKTGEPIKYRVFRRTREGMYVDPVDVAAAKFLHLFDPLRIDQYRGITALDAAIPTCRDIYDIMRYEKFAVKWSSSNTAVIERKGGDPDEWNTKQDNGQLLEEIQYGRINYVGEGESVSPFQSQRPNANFEAFIQQMERQVCLSLQIPYGFFVNSEASGGGVAGRLESQKAHRLCARYQTLLSERILNPVKNSFLSWAITNNILPSSQYYRSGRWQFPAWPTADIGRESAANIEEHKLGLKTAADIYAEQGKDWEEEFEQIAREQVTLDRLAKQYNIPVDRLSQRNPNPPVEETVDAPTAPAVVKKKVDQPSARKQFAELWDQHSSEFNCGTGRGGFATGNKCGARSAAGRANANVQTAARTQLAQKLEDEIRTYLGFGGGGRNAKGHHVAMDGTSVIGGRNYLMEVKAINVAGVAKTQKATIRRECMQRKIKILKQQPKGTRVLLVTVNAKTKRYNLWRGLGSPRIDTPAAKKASVNSLAALKKQMMSLEKTWNETIPAGNKYPDER